MLPKKNKITRRAYPPRSQCAYVWEGSFIRVYCYKNGKNKQNKGFSVVIPKRLVKTAVERNYFKRVLYSLIGENMILFNVSPFDFYVITPKIHVEKMTYKILRDDMLIFLKNLAKQ